MTLQWHRPIKTLITYKSYRTNWIRPFPELTRSGRYNFRIRGLLKSITDVPTAVQSFIKSLITDILPHKSELDRAHRAFGPPHKDGAPKDVVVKAHSYAVKEEIMKKSHSQALLLCQNNPVQIFAHIFPVTIQRSHSLKPLLNFLFKKI